jgi:hypothetical protein
MDNYGGEQAGNDMPLGSTPATTQPAPVTKPQAPAPLETTPQTETMPAADIATAQIVTPAEASTVSASPVAAQPVARSINRADYREQVSAPVEIPGPVAETAIAAVERPRVAEVVGAPQQIINDPAVTVPNAGTYNTIEVPTGEDARGSIAREDHEKKGSMRGFLRKTTRFIERRTGIDPTNEGDELMIGALTINLK